MKEITCAELGGPATCTTVITGSTSKEMIDTGWKHIEQEHSELADQIKNNPPGVNDKWMAEFAEKFDSLPEAQ